MDESLRLVCERGGLIRIAKNQKRPRGNGWQNRPLTLDELEKAIAAGANFGLLLGPTSGYIDVECDSADAEPALIELFGGDPQTVGWQSSRGNHRLFAWDDRLSGLGGSKKINGVEFRLGADGMAMQSLIPPSTTDGFTRQWIKSFADCEVAALPESIIAKLLSLKSPAMPAAASSLTPLIPTPSIPTLSDFEAALRACRRIRMKDGKDGSRRLFAICCRGVEYDLSDEQIIALVRYVEKGKAFPKSFSDADIIRRIRDAEEKTQRGSARTNKPEIDVTTFDLADVTSTIWAIVKIKNEPPVWFRYGGQPARIERGDNGEPVIQVLNFGTTRYQLVEWIRFYRVSSDGKVYPVAPPDTVVVNVRATPDQPLPILVRVVETPVFADDGSLVTTPGYHAGPQVLYLPPDGFELPAVPETPTTADIDRAKSLILDDLLGDFPFVSDAEMAHAVSLCLLPAARNLIDGATPLTLIEATCPGTGKTLLLYVATYPTLGREVAAFTEGSSEDEWRKRLTAKLREGSPYIVIDNLKNTLDSAAVAAALTADYWEDRILGSSTIVKIPMRSVWVATGNNAGLSSELTRRTVRIRLDAKVDRPWLRDGFRHPDLRAWVKENRADLVWASLTLIRAWIVAGKPAGGKLLGMYENWSRVMGGILSVAGIAGFLDNLPEFYDASDSEGQNWRSFLSAWWDQHKSAAIKAADLFPIAVDEIGLSLGAGGEHGQKTKLGKLLGDSRERVFELSTESGSTRVRVDRAGERHRAHLWQLTPLADIAV
jgi:Bifunctional DNA primase/polymerase, N-terminal